MKLSELAKQIDGVLEGSGDVEINGVAAVDEAGEGELSFIANPKYAQLAATTCASALIVDQDWDHASPASLIRIENPDAAFAKAAMLFYTPAPVLDEGIHPSAVVSDDVELGEGVRIGPLCVIESGVYIGAGSVISAQCYIGHGVRIGAGCLFHPNVSIREHAQIGSRVIIHNGTVIGSDGFGYSVSSEGVRTKIPQIGIVEVGDDVEIGANVAVDRARFGKTRIGKGVKIDNLVQIAHNVVIGDHSVIVAQVGISGSSTLGEKVIIAGQAGVAGHLKIGAGSVIGARSGVVKDIPAGEYVMGFPAIPALKYKKMQAMISRIPKLKGKLAELEGKISQLQSSM
jgi:UDP-3-O-[3-hydroxymyristoyl] glucosamine N-acyltransferase